MKIKKIFRLGSYSIEIRFPVHEKFTKYFADITTFVFPERISNEFLKTFIKLAELCHLNNKTLIN